MQGEDKLLAALGIVLQEAGRQVGRLNRAGARALEKGDYEQARQLTERGAQTAAFRERVKRLQIDWKGLIAAPEPKKKPRRRVRVKKRLKPGLRTPESAFRDPILQALVDLGGSGGVQQVLDRVGEAMVGQLNEHDRAALPSTPGVPRWRNTAQWARQALVKEGLLAAGSPRGVWQISEEGRRWLAAG